MAKYLFLLSVALALLLAGCTNTIAGNGIGNGNSTLANDSNGTGNVTYVLPGYGKALVTVQDVVSGCGTEPPDGDTTDCGVHYATPRTGKFDVSVYSLSSISLGSTEVISVYTAETTNTLGPVLEVSVEADSRGMFTLDLPPGDYGFMIYTGGEGRASERFTIEEGKTTAVGVDFVKMVPQRQ